MTRRRATRQLPALLLLAFLFACRREPLPEVAPPAATAASLPAPTQPAPTEHAPTATAAPTATTPAPTATVAPTVDSAVAEPVESGRPAAVFYDLGETTIVQSNFPEDSRFHNMPVRLQGVIAAPDAGAGPFPVVLILHGANAGCPADEGGADRWPCDPEMEQSNYAGFEYLVRDLAARGYVALAINSNAENTLGFGEAPPGQRLLQLVELHLSALAEAARGGENSFGLELAGVADMGRLALIGHAQGGEMASWLTLHTPLGSPLAFANLGYGPVAGLLLIAPARAVQGSVGADVPLAVILPACDGEINQLDGQGFYEGVRLEPAAAQWATTVLLEGANHNHFNSLLGPDFFQQSGRPGCATLMAPKAQRQFLADYAADFLTMLFSDPAARLDAAARLGLDPRRPAPAALYNQPATLTSVAAATDRMSVYVPNYENALTLDELGGAVTSAGARLFYCPPGYYTPFSDPGTEPCRRPNFVMPGNPGMLVVSWDRPAALRLEMPAGTRDLSRYTTIALRAALDPLSALNAAGAPQSFSVRLTDGAGRMASVVVEPDAPALQYPPGDVSEDPSFGQMFRGLVHMTAIRLPLTAFTGIDASDVAEIALVFDQTPAGTLFIADVDVSRPPHIVGAYSALLSNADGANDALASVGRFDGAATCTGTFLDVGGGPDEPAYLLTSGRCAADGDANRITTDAPAPGWTVTFNYFADNSGAHLTIPAARVAYSTMKGRDVAVVELAATVGELTGLGLMPLPLALAEPDEAFALRVVGAPVSGSPAAPGFLREERCRATGRADLFESLWHFDKAYRTTCQDIYAGSSGSPAFDGDVNAIVALINTANNGGLAPCALGSPCEVAPGGTFSAADASYAMPVVGLEACFPGGRFNLLGAGCPLDDGRQLLVSGYPAQGTQSPIRGPNGQPAAPTWNATLTGDLPYYRYQVGRAGVVDCRDETSYGPVIALAERSRIDDALPPEEGSYLLCVIAGPTATPDASWQPAGRATIARAAVDNTPPTQTPRLSARADGRGGFLFEPIFAEPELADFLIKSGPVGETDCASRAGYARYRRIPLTIPSTDTPARACVIGIDSAGNEGQPTGYELGMGQ